MACFSALTAIVLGIAVLSSTSLAAICSGDAAEIATWRDAHNEFRASHGAVDLAWDASLAQKSKDLAARCDMKPSEDEDGENFGLQNGLRSVKAFVNSWTAQEKDYTPSSDDLPPNFNKVSCFTQVVWKATSRLGCSCTLCPPGTPLGDRLKSASFGVCLYDSPGNMDGEFSENVQLNNQTSSI